jgi:tripartite-type tricarboxylate transporter receptor subunit TctC
LLTEPDVRQRLFELSIEARPSSPDELMTLFKSDVRKWGDVIAGAGIEKR